METTTATGDLREARRRAGYTQIELARIVDCSVAFVRQLEQGAIPRRSNVLPRIWRALAAPNDEGLAAKRALATTSTAALDRDDVYRPA